MAKIGTDIVLAAEMLRDGKLVGIPTETVYGLAGNALLPEVIEELYSVKGRPKNKAFIIQTDDLRKLDGFIKSSSSEIAVLAKKYWPGALTIVFEAGPKAPKNLISDQQTIGVRIPNHPMTLDLLSRIDFPIAVPSANIHTMPSPKTASEVNNQLGDQIGYILDGGSCLLGFESTIIGFDANGPIIYREGVIPKLEILETLKTALKAKN